MKDSSKVLLMVLLISLFILASCKNAPSTTSGNNPSSNTQINTNPSKLTASGRPEPDSVKSIHYSKLMEFLPNPPSGWNAEEPFGFMYQMENGAEWSQAGRLYNRGDEDNLQKAEVHIMDSAYYNVGYWATWISFTEFQSGLGYGKHTKIKGYEALEIYNKAQEGTSDKYNLYINVNDRFMVWIFASTKEDMNTFANVIDYDGLAALAK